MIGLILVLALQVLLLVFVVIENCIYWFDNPYSTVLRKTLDNLYDWLGITEISAVILIPMVLVISIPMSLYCYWIFLKWIFSKKVSRC